jgi:PAS domain S-box-containing protein
VAITKSRNPTNSSRLTIGLFIDGLESDFHVDLVSSISDYAKENEINFICYITGRLDSTFEWEKNKNLLFDFIDENVIDGILVSVTTLANLSGKNRVEDIFQRFNKIPIVAISEKLCDFPAILVENKSPFEELIKHMVVDHGYKKLAFITGPDGATEAEARYGAYRKVLETYGIPFNEDLVVSGNFIIRSGYDAVRVLLDERKVDFDAIVCANDNMAFGVMTEMKINRKIFPFPVIGIDDRIYSKELQLTTLRYPTRDAGRSAIELLINKIKGEPVPNEIVLSMEVLIRESCGCNIHRNGKDTIDTHHTNLIESSFDSQIHQIIIKIINSIPKIGSLNEKIVSTRLKQIIHSIIEDTKNKCISKFREEWTDFINDALTGTLNLSLVHDILSLLRKYLLQFIREVDILAFIHNLFYHAELMLWTALNKQEAFNKILSRENSLSMDQLEFELAGSLNIDRKFDILEQRLPSFGIQNLFISLYEDMDCPLLNSRLIFALHRGRRLSIEKGGIIFPTKELIPQIIISTINPYCLYVENLYRGNMNLGFVAIEYDTKIDNIYQKLHGIINDSLYTSLLLDKISKQAIRLETKVKEQTNDIYQKNIQLELEIAEKNKIETRLKKNEEKFKQMALLLPSIIIDTDLNMNIKFMNKAGLDLFHLKDEDLNRNISFSNYIVPEDIKMVKDTAERTLAGESLSFNIFRVQTSKGNIIDFLCKALQLSNDSIVEGLRWNAIDMKSLIMASITPELTLIKEFNLSNREKEIFEKMCKGLKIKDIADSLFITEGTVKDHIGSIYSKLSVKNREEFFNFLKNYHINRFGYNSYIFSILKSILKE